MLALGDTSYEHFCQTGKDFDKRLEELGGKRIAPRVDCDVDFDEAAAGWMDSVLAALAKRAAQRGRVRSAGAASRAAAAVSRGGAAPAEVFPSARTRSTPKCWRI